MKSTIEILEEIGARADAATEGPWRLDHYPSGTVFVELNMLGNVDMHEESGGAHVGGPYGNPQAISSEQYQRERSNNGNFIAHSRTDVPRMKKALELAVERLKNIANNRPHDPAAWARVSLDLINKKMNGDD